MPLKKLAENHLVVQRSILKLIRHSPPESPVNFVLVHNTGARGVTGKPLQLTYDDLAQKGPLHYSLAYARYYAKAAEEIQRINPAKGERVEKQESDSQVGTKKRFVDFQCALL
ncbi:MAG: hypothetical protein ACR2OZ_17360 [Verrucomicrobiales bacterium]